MKDISGKKVLIIDAGTCLKFDFIDSDAAYLGGSISPGLYMRYTAVHQFTEKHTGSRGDAEGYRAKR